MCERLRPALPQRQDPLRGNEEQLLLLSRLLIRDPSCQILPLFRRTPDTSSPGVQARLHASQRDLRAFGNETSHSLSEIDIQKNMEIITPVHTGAAELIFHLRRVHQELQQLQYDALSRRLRSDQHREAAKAYFRSSDRAEMANREALRNGTHARAKDGWRHGVS